MSLYSLYGFTKLKPPPRSTYSYVSEIIRQQQRRILAEAIILLLFALIGIGLLLIPVIVVTPR